ncbi:hypothetical protein A9986_01120 [Solibacillus silvestris]|nr:hypothetical protein A9986_01120 [Solibacillus silvestris]
MGHAHGNSFFFDFLLILIYVKFMGNNKNGKAKFEFVGTNNNGDITTYHTQSGKKRRMGDKIPFNYE